MSASSPKQLSARWTSRFKEPVPKSSKSLGLKKKTLAVHGVVVVVVAAAAAGGGGGGGRSSSSSSSSRSIKVEV